MNFAPERSRPRQVRRSWKGGGCRGCPPGGLPLVESSDSQSVNQERQYRLRTKAPPTLTTASAYPVAMAAGKPRKKDRKADTAFPQTLREKQTQMRGVLERWPLD